MATPKLKPTAPGVDRYVGPEYQPLIDWCAADLPGLSFDRVREAYAMILSDHGRDPRALAIVGLADRYFLLTALCGRQDALDPWLYARCREVEASPDGHLDLWAREHYKSTVITFAGAIQEGLRNPETTIGIFSHTRPIAKGFLKQIKRELEGNETLKWAYPDALWQNPKNDSPKWSEDDGLILIRKTNPKESTYEAHGVVDGQPTSKHFDVLIFDDVVTRESVTTPEMVKKTTEALELADNLGTQNGKKWMIGTRYSFADTYATLLERGSVIPRIYPATDTGRLDGKPVFLSPEAWEKKKREQPTQISAQMLQNPSAGDDATFNVHWLRAWQSMPDRMNIYIMVDPSKGSGRTSDRTAIAVIAVDVDGNKHLVDGYRHRMNLAQRWDALRDIYRLWKNRRGVQRIKVGYERYGMQSDIEHFETRMNAEGFRFDIEELGGPKSKTDRVERLVPDLLAGTFLVSPTVWHETRGECSWSISDDRIGFQSQSAKDKPIKRKDENGQPYDLTRDFFEEIELFPFGSHDDLLDAAARIYDMTPERPSTNAAGNYQPPDTKWII